MSGVCDFTKRCLLSFRLNTGIARVQASVFGKKTRGRAILRSVSREPRHRPIRGGGGFFVLCENQGGREGRFCHFD